HKILTNPVYAGAYVFGRTSAVTRVENGRKRVQRVRADRSQWRSLLGILPPFHSFGLTGTMLLPLLSGIRVVHHPDPNAVAVLSKIIAEYRPTLLPSTPTFIANIVRASGPNDLRSLRICVTGAEKCPSEVYEAVRKSCPQAVILEGYGITECSPILAVMREDDVQPGTVGKPMPSVVTAIADIDSHQRVEVGGTGMLLVRGPSIFGGYLHDTGPSPFEVFDGETWYRTGDLVKADTQNRVTFMGRLTRFAKIGGEMVSLPAIEAVLSRRYALPEDTVPCLAVVPTPNDVHPELVLWTSRPLERAQVNRTIQQGGLSGLHNIRIVREIAQIPLLGSGKIDYRTLAQLLAEKPSS
ncbi:MAG: AMP-binding protein, partial [Gammaproteobacteria bacterium]|nr:AMP-binding protein [Gammaproteobacteria bacterium]